MIHFQQAEIESIKHKSPGQNIIDFYQKNHWQNQAHAINFFQSLDLYKWQVHCAKVWMDWEESYVQQKWAWSAKKTEQMLRIASRQINERKNLVTVNARHYLMFH